MSIFEEFINLCGDFAACQAAYLDAHERAKDILGAVKNRLEAERAQTSARVAELEVQTQDPGRSETVRRMAALELAQLQARTYTVTKDEQAAFADAVNDAETAVRDMRQLSRKIREAIDSLNEEIKQMRANTLGFDVDMRGNWIEGIRRDFDRLGGGSQ